jgi:predicted nucleic acid-binding Zn ribbon protein
MKTPKKIGTILEEFLKRNKRLRKKINEEKIKQTWGEIVGEKISSHTKPLYINSGILFVRVNNPVWCHELSFLREEIKKKINKTIKENLIKNIRLVS